MRRFVFFLFLGILGCNSYNEELLIAEKHFHQGEFLASLDLYNKILCESPNHYDALEARARVYKELGEFENAFNDINRVLEIHPNISENLVLRGSLYVKREQKKLAKLDYEKAVLIDSNAFAFNNLASLLMDSLKYDSAMIFCNIALNHREEAAFFNNRGYLFELMEKSVLAILDYNSAIMLDSLQPFYFYNRSISKYHNNDVVGSIEDLTTAIHLYPNFKECFYYRGIAYHELGYHELAYNDLSIAANMGVEYATERIVEWYSDIYTDL